MLSINHNIPGLQIHKNPANFIGKLTRKVREVWTIGRATRGGKMPRRCSYRDELLQDLQDREEAQAYLNAALSDTDPRVFLLAFRDVVDAHIGQSQLAERTGRNRKSLYRSLSTKGHPAWKIIRIILDTLVLTRAVQPSQAPLS
jgi:probable addiction module antidote protein